MIPQSDPSSLPLRDIHFPDAITWWPLAPGWWLLALTIIVMIIIVTLLIRHKRNYQRSAIYLAKQELEKIKNEYNLNQNKKNLAQALSELIRRVTISLYNREETASLTGKKWLSFLDQFNNRQQFSQGVGQSLIEAPYQDKPEFDSAELIQLVSIWIDTLEQQGAAK